MMFSDKFITATRYFAAFKKHISAPLFRKTFIVNELPKNAEIFICGLGFYRAFINGEEFTKGYLAPYISNPDEVLYYDEYDITDKLKKGKNVLSFILGNGMINNVGGFIWNFDKANFRSPPKLAFSLDLDGEITEADTDVKTYPSAILFDDLRAGEYYDARLETDAWKEIDFDDSKWKRALKSNSPSGIKRICAADPIIVEQKISPVKITKGDGGYIYDFGINTAGIIELKINAESGQTLEFVHGEVVNDGKVDLANISFNGYTLPNYNQYIKYICKSGVNVYRPSFCYMGFRYVFVSGIKDEQATDDLLTMLKMHSDVKKSADFNCSDISLNKIYENAINSTYSNFWYFPTDCPQREKNGWTGDVTLSADQMMLDFNAETSLREWLFNVRAAQTKDGKLPGIVPTTGDFGYKWGNGPGWDAVIVEVPYRIYQYTGNKNIITENADAIFKYLNYMSKRRRDDGLTAYGLGDWCQVNVPGVENYSTPLFVSDTLICMDMCQKAGTLFDAINQKERALFCKTLYNELRSAFRKVCVMDDCKIVGETQTGQAMAIYYGAFDDSEKPQAFKILRQLIKEKDDHFDVGVLGGRVLFRVLADFGEQDLAYKLIVQPSFPSFGYQLSLGATSLWESFYELNERFEPIKFPHLDILSQNHHFWSDVAAFFIEYIGGIRINPYLKDIRQVIVSPKIFKDITSVTVYKDMPYGRISVHIEKTGKKHIAYIEVPNGCFCKLVFGNYEKALSAGKTETEL